MAFEKVELDTWKPQEVNESVEGIFMKAEENVGQNNSMLYNMEVEGKLISVWGSAVLDPKMNAVKPNDLIKIVYLGKGEAKPGKNAAKLYELYIDHEHRAKVEAQAPAQTEAPAKAAEFSY